MARRISAQRKKAIQETIGDPRAIAESLQRFQKAARAFSSRHPRLIEQYNGEWVAVYDGEVVAHAGTHDDLLSELDRRKLPRGEVMTRFVEKNQRTLIL